MPHTFADTKIYEWAISAANLGVWTYDLRNGSWWLSQSAGLILGIGAGSKVSRERFMDCLSSIERLRVETAWSRLIDDAVAYDLEYVIELDGCERWVWERAEIEMGPDGEASRILGVLQDVTARRASEKQIRYRANHDALTALPNRHMLDEFLEKSVAMSGRRNERMALLAIDLDRFKQVNDSYGHAVGDHVLQAASKRMLGCLRSSDMLARQGGDEFIAVLQGVDYDATVGLIALRLIEERERHLRPSNRNGGFAMGAFRRALPFRRFSKVWGAATTVAVEARARRARCSVRGKVRQPKTMGALGLARRTRPSGPQGRQSLFLTRILNLIGGLIITCATRPPTCRPRLPGLSGVNSGT